MSAEQFGSVARGFITNDFKQALYVVRMREEGRKSDRDKIIKALMAKPSKHEMQLDLLGGTYYMQSELAKKIEQSMRKGILSLVILFGMIALIISRAFFLTLFSFTSIVLIVSSIIGLIGYFGIPIDIISSPSINICLGLAVDGMIHLIMDLKRNSQKRVSREGLKIAFENQAKPIFVSALVISSGFSVFYLSQFPPSQRFGLEIVAGSVIAAIVTLIFLTHSLVLVLRKK